MENNKYVISSTPHMRSNESIDTIMKHVVIALMPASLAGIYFFGIRAFIIICISIGSCVLFEYIFTKIAKKSETISDFSAVVTGLLLAMNLSTAVPFWIPVVGSFFAIIVVKFIFGGLGQNFMNPALAARAFLLASYGKEMTTWIKPNTNFDNFFSIETFDAITQATPLAEVKNGDFIASGQNILNAFLGNTSGSIGETSAILIILGGVYLIYHKVINWITPVIYIFSTFIFSMIIGNIMSIDRFYFYELFLGGLMLGAFFMATDYSSSPITQKGKFLMGFGCGFLTSVIRIFGPGPEIVSYAILIMNLFVPIIDKYTKPKVFGVV